MLNCPPERKRHLLLEGDLKLKDSNTSKVSVYSIFFIILFEFTIFVISNVKTVII